MAVNGWEKLIESWPWFRGKGNFPLLPNSEFMPPVRCGLSLTGPKIMLIFPRLSFWLADHRIRKERPALRPGLKDIAHRVRAHLAPLARRADTHGIFGQMLKENTYWPRELSRHAGALSDERFVYCSCPGLCR